MNKSMTDKTESNQLSDPYDTAEKVFACVKKLIQAHNKSINEHNAKVSTEAEKLPLIKADNSTTMDGLAIAFSILHVPNSLQVLGVDTSILAMTVVYDHDKDTALNTTDFGELMRHIENIMGTYHLDYTADSVREGYYKCMYHYGESLQNAWGSMLNCHRTILIHTDDAMRLFWQLASDEEREMLEDYNHKLYRSKFVERTPLSVQIPGHRFSINR